jgi:hypothetical protein
LQNGTLQICPASAGDEVSGGCNDDEYNQASDAGESNPLCAESGGYGVSEPRQRFQGYFAVVHGPMVVFARHSRAPFAHLGSMCLESGKAQEVARGFVKNAGRRSGPYLPPVDKAELELR